MANILSQPLRLTLHDNKSRYAEIPAWQRRLLRESSAILGFAVTLAITIIALCAPFIVPGNPFRNVGQALASPSMTHWFGTDDLGRDIFAELVHGARASLLVGWAVAFISAVCGILVGGVAGFFGRWVDDILMRLTELFQVSPRLFLAIIVAAFFGGNLLNTILVLGLTFWSPPPAFCARKFFRCAKANL